MLGFNKHHTNGYLLKYLKKKKKKKKKTFAGLVRYVGGLITVGGISDLKRLLDWVRGSKSCDF